jgi:hypothetical protein
LSLSLAQKGVPKQPSGALSGSGPLNTVTFYNRVFK